MTHRDRLAGARDEIARLAAAERRYFESFPIRLRHEHDMRAGRYLVRAEVREPVPAELLGMIEAIARGLRGALDELTTALAGAPTKFPVHETLPLFAQRSRKALSRLPDHAQAAIEALQPYHAIGGFQNGPLWVLDQLASADRPRLAAGAVREGAMLGVNTKRKVEISGALEVPAAAFDDGDVIAAVQSKVVGPDPKLDMFLRADLALAFARKGPARGREVVELLGALADHVEQVLDDVESAATNHRREA